MYLSRNLILEIDDNMSFRQSSISSSSKINTFIYSTIFSNNLSFPFNYKTNNLPIF